VPDKSPRKPARPAKKTWRRPNIKSGKLFESNSLACGKLAQDDGCQQMGQIKSS
jgi:hypothetical protein